jgi:hypothetical protein
MASGTIHGKFADVLAAAPPGLRPVCRALRKLIAANDRDFVEVVWRKQQIASYGVGPRKMSEHYAYIGVQSSHVNLGFYHGSALADPAGLLEGTGRRLRHVKVRSVAAALAAALAALLRRAIADRERHAGARPAP